MPIAFHHLILFKPDAGRTLSGPSLRRKRQLHLPRVTIPLASRYSGIASAVAKDKSEDYIPRCA